ncbi:MAG TPA: hypothetical protein VMZ91_10880 [Candidatus Paceibacterota bacterium]|nr:hypothetical protein [Candidatus Paceibacterota bacterium]
MPDKKKPRKKQKPKPPPEPVGPSVLVFFKCRDCGYKKTEKEIIKDLDFLALKAKRCESCKKWGTYLAEYTIEKKKNLKAIISYEMINRKLIVIDEETNTNLSIKKKIYPSHYDRKRLKDEKPYLGINHCKNHANSAEFFVDENLKPKGL